MCAVCVFVGLCGCVNVGLCVCVFACLWVCVCLSLRTFVVVFFDAGCFCVCPISKGVIVFVPYLSK